MLAISIVCCICMAAGNLWGMYGADLAEMNGWNHFQTAIPYTVSSIVGCFTGVLGGLVSDSRFPGKLTAVGAVVIGTGLVCLGIFRTSLPMVAFSQGFLMIACQNFASVGLVSAAMKWFPVSQKARASGLATLGMSMSNVVTTLLYQGLTGKLGFTAGMCTLGIIYGTIGAILAWSFVPAPEEVLAQNQKQEGGPGASGKKPVRVIYRNVPWKEAVRTHEFRLIIVIFCLCMFGNLAVNSQAVLIIRSFSDSAFPPWLFIVIGAFGGIAARLTTALIGDRVGTFRTWLILCAALSACLLCFPFAGNVLLMLIVYTVQQFCVNAIIVCNYASFGLVFDPGCTGLLTGIGTTGYYIAGIIAPAAAALISDRAGSYTPVFLGLAFIEAITAVLLFRLNRIYQKKLEVLGAD